MTSSHALRGRPLERAIARAGRAYQQAGRCELRKQETPMRMGQGGQRFYAARSPIDFRGTLLGGRSLAIEAKQVTSGLSLPVQAGVDLKYTSWNAAQQDALGEQHRLGAWTRLVVAFDVAGETFGLDWPVLEKFLTSPWRASLSLDFCRAYGDLLPDAPRHDPRSRSVLFLDGRPHPDREGAGVRLRAEAEKARQRERSAPTGARVRRARVGAPSLAEVFKSSREVYRERIFAACDQGQRTASRRRP